MDSTCVHDYLRRNGPIPLFLISLWSMFFTVAILKLCRKNRIVSKSEYSSECETSNDDENNDSDDESEEESAEQTSDSSSTESEDDVSSNKSQFKYPNIDVSFHIGQIHVHFGKDFLSDLTSSHVSKDSDQGWSDMESIHSFHLSSESE